MATGLLERTVIKYFKEEELKYQVLGDDVVEIGVSMSEFFLPFRVTDHETSPPIIDIAVVDFVRFQNKNDAMRMCNELNNLQFGKFIVDEYGDVTYRFGYPLSANPTSEDFGLVFAVVVSLFQQNYPIIMDVRHANVTVEQAIERKTERPVSDDDIESLMNRPPG